MWRFRLRERPYVQRRCFRPITGIFLATLASRFRSPPAARGFASAGPLLSFGVERQLCKLGYVGLGSLCKPLHSGHYAQVATMRRCRETDGAGPYGVWLSRPVRPAHSFGDYSNPMSESGPRNRRNLVPGTSSRAEAFSFTASFASTLRCVTVVLSWWSPEFGPPLHSAAETMSRSTLVDFANHGARIESTNSSSHDLRIVATCA